MAYAYNLDKALGCIVGGSVGDALGYPVEFRRSFDEIQQLCGPNGISRYRIEEGRTAHFSDDSQMTLKHTDSFEDAVVAAVNHSGDSDSTGAICCNIMGLVHGYEAIPTHFNCFRCWKKWRRTSTPAAHGRRIRIWTGTGHKVNFVLFLRKIVCLFEIKQYLCVKITQYGQGARQGAEMNSKGIRLEF